MNEPVRSKTRRAQPTSKGWTEPRVLHIPYMTKQMRRWAVSKRRDVVLRRVVTYQERYKAILGPDHFKDVCSHLHKTYQAAEHCRTALNKQAITADTAHKGK